AVRRARAGRDRGGERAGRAGADRHPHGGDQRRGGQTPPEGQQDELHHRRQHGRGRQEGRGAGRVITTVYREDTKTTKITKLFCTKEIRVPSRSSSLREKPSSH